MYDCVFSKKQVCKDCERSGTDSNANDSDLQTCVEKHTQPCLAVHIQTQLLQYLCMHLQPCYWNCTQNCIQPLRTEHFCPSPMLRPAAWAMEPCFALLQVHLQHFCPNTALPSTRGATKADQVVRAREDFQYSIAIGLRLICTFRQGTEV